ncbi:hydroxymethylglutaryl-CoA lyase [Rubellimicrobium rubrum]|uniref:Hydroxymethylglutaryl-CoA lyase n=1 Tax=Rubellimicrobium rubrum TaxID=2585369 RepID=A0A5C4N9N2_9RHOB|nr:hydroxymethylglutaryl-CoA lyase [Rubellimicrobium rubrum]TNC52992.1 hydroxymethylglutaryl-CoA lyase [Rubellimicrobium rubrum]
MTDVEIVEVGPRDGLQNEPRLIPTPHKTALVDALAVAGFRRIEAASFVSPRRVPQMEDGAAVLAAIRRPERTGFVALVPNLRGYEAAHAARVDEIAVFTAASEGFAKANLNCTIAESLDRLAPVVRAAHGDGLPVRGYVSVVTDCPFDGPTAPSAVGRVAAALRDMGCDEISLGETLGRGTPERVEAMLRAVLEELSPDRLAGHFHDTGGRALDNVEVALQHGLRIFDASIAGLGGCPFAPGAAGNVATEALHDRLVALGYHTGLDPVALARAATFARSLREP